MKSHDSMWYPWSHMAEHVICMKSHDNIWYPWSHMRCREASPSKTKNVHGVHPESRTSSCSRTKEQRGSRFLLSDCPSSSCEGRLCSRINDRRRYSSFGQRADEVGQQYNLPHSLMRTSLYNWVFLSPFSWSDSHSAPVPRLVICNVYCILLKEPTISVRSIYIKRKRTLNPVLYSHGSAAAFTVFQCKWTLSKLEWSSNKDFF